jgi:hypothetical protein
MEQRHVSYLAIAVDQQLEWWTLETEHASKFLSLRAERLHEAKCFWAVLPVDAAKRVDALMQKGKKPSATRVLQSSVVDWGTVSFSNVAQDGYSCTE